jgi:hypothetical protein
MAANPQKIIQNLTPKRLKIHGNDGHVLILPPLEKNCQLSSDEEPQFPGLQRLAMQHYIRILEARDAGSMEPQIRTLFYGCLMGVGVITYIIYQVLTDGGKRPADPQYLRWLKFASPSFFLIAISLGILLLFILRRGDKGKEFLQWISRWIAQALSLVLILTLGLVLPSIAFYFFGGGRDLIISQNSLAKLGRSLQLIFIFTASLLPALLYFLFDRQQLGTLRQRFEQQIFRLDPNVESLCDVAAKYGRQIDEIYGRESAGGEGRLVRGTRWPILVATLVMTLGWMLTLLPAGPQSDTVQPGQLLDFFVPPQSAVIFGFLGAYFFVLNTVLHRYVRADLKPKAYSSITVRMLVVFILSWVIGLGFGASVPALMITFIIGVFPESGLTLIRESIRNQTGFGKIVGLIGSRTKERYPLTELKELDVYDRARLLDEGVTNIEGLAHHDLIDLMLETRIPVPRLVDWIDQAILYLHLEMGDMEAGHEDKKLPNPNGNVADEAEHEEEKLPNPNGNVAYMEGLRNLNTFLQDNCIRTATDFIVTYNKGEKGALQRRATDDLRSRLQVLFESLEDDEWLDHIRHWRDSSRVMDQVLDASSDSFSPGPYASVTIADFKSQNGTYHGDFRVDRRAVDVLVATPELEKVGVKPIGETTYRSNDGVIETVSFGLAQIFVEEETTAGRVLFGPENVESIVPLWVIESIGFTVDPVSNSLKRVLPIPSGKNKPGP